MYFPSQKNWVKKPEGYLSWGETFSCLSFFWQLPPRNAFASKKNSRLNIWDIGNLPTRVHQIPCGKLQLLILHIFNYVPAPFRAANSQGLISPKYKTNEKETDKDKVRLKRKHWVIRSMQGHQISQKEGSPFGILELFEANIARECFFKLKISCSSPPLQPVVPLSG